MNPWKLHAMTMMPARKMMNALAGSVRENRKIVSMAIYAPTTVVFRVRAAFMFPMGKAAMMVLTVRTMMSVSETPVWARTVAMTIMTVLQISAIPGERVLSLRWKTWRFVMMGTVVTFKTSA